MSHSRAVLAEAWALRHLEERYGAIQEDGSRPQLYNLLKDSSESENLAAEHPEIVERLGKSVLAWNETLPR